MLRNAVPFILAVLTVLAFPALPGSAEGDDLVELGWLEYVRILPENMVLKAKLDTGANTSAISAKQITRFERDGRPWVRFNVSDRKGAEVEFERPITRVVRVKRSDDPAKARPVVLLTICLAGRFREESFTLANRAHLNYVVLIGRTVLSQRFLVVPARKYTHKPDCIGR